MITGYPENEGRMLFRTLAHPRRGAAGLQPPPPHPFLKRNLKKNEFYDTVFEIKLKLCIDSGLAPPSKEKS